MAKLTSSRRLPTESLPVAVLIARNPKRVQVWPAGTTYWSVWLPQAVTPSVRSGEK